MEQLQLILASGSPQRKKLLSDAGYHFEVLIPDESVECGVCSTGGPAGMVAEIAFKKATDVFQKYSASAREQPAILIACDTMAECGGSMLGKPKDEDHARQMLTLLRGRQHRVYSGLCIWPVLLGDQTPEPQTRIATTVLRMDDVSDDLLEDYLESGLWKGKAGAFGYQDRVGWLHIEQGTESNVIGLPVELLEEMLSPWKDALRQV